MRRATPSLAAFRPQLNGVDEYYQLGTGKNTNSPVAIASTLLGTATSCGTGGDNTCVLGLTGGVQCLGRNRYGEVGDGTTTQRTSPVPVAGVSTGATSLALGSFHSCVISDSPTGVTGGVECWGRNDTGQLGNGNVSSYVTAATVKNLSSAIQVAPGDAHTCALTSAGQVMCWGDSSSGQLGNGDTTSSPTPVAVTGM